MQEFPMRQSFPISSGASTTNETVSAKLVEYITNARVYEHTNNKDHIVNKLSELVSEWVDTIAKKKNIDLPSGETGAHVRVFGSHSLGVITKGGDMDLVALVPKFIYREDFSASFVCALKTQPQITRIRVLAQAYVPIINLYYEDTEVDLCLCVMVLDVIPGDLDLLNDDLLDGMDELSVRSISGIRESAIILSLIPDISVFTATLKVIKHWSKCRCVNHYRLGFLGGIAWAIMVAKIHQMHPEDDVLALLTQFFRTFLEWQWPEPVLLRSLRPNTKSLQQWNPEVFSADGRHVMAVITPAYPEHNAAFTALHCTTRIIQQELARGSELIDKIQQGEETWDSLFLPLQIEKQYKHFLVVTAQAMSPEHIRDWGGLVEARIVVLTRGLEQQAAVSLIHPGTESRSSIRQR